MLKFEDFLLTFYAASPFPSPPAYRQAGTGEREEVEKGTQKYSIFPPKIQDSPD